MNLSMINLDFSSDSELSESDESYNNQEKARIFRFPDDYIPTNLNPDEFSNYCNAQLRVSARNLTVRKRQ